MSNEEIDNWSDYDSGPFCRHWSSPWSCNKMCLNCNHECSDHFHDEKGNSACHKFLCNCEIFID